MNNKLRVGVVGSRDWEDKLFIFSVLRDFLRTRQDKDIVLVSGGAKGVDTYAEEFAQLYNYPIEIFRADWKRYGRSAGFIRNELIAKNSDIIFAFRKNNSSGTTHTITLARKFNIALQVYDA